MEGERALITGGAGAVGSNIADESVRAGTHEVVVLDNFVRGRRENLAWAMENGPVRIVHGDVRDRELVDELTRNSNAIGRHSLGRGLRGSDFLQGGTDRRSIGVDTGYRHGGRRRCRGTLSGHMGCVAGRHRAWDASRGRGYRSPRCTLEDGGSQAYLMFTSCN